MSAVLAESVAPQQGQLVTEPRVRHSQLRSYAPGQSGNPAGRPIGARNRITESFLQDLHQTWQEGGIQALRRIMEDDPSTYCRIAASIIPKQSAHIRATVNTNRPLDSINAELIQAVQALGYSVTPSAEQGSVVPGECVAVPVESDDSQAADPHALEKPTGGLASGNTGMPSGGETVSD